MSRWLLLLLMLPVLVQASGMRSLDPISPDNDGAAVPVSREAVRTFVHALAEAWNNQELEPLLAPDFPDRERLLASLPERVVPGARIRIDAVGPIETVEQERRANVVISLVLVRFRGQLEIPDDDGGFQRHRTTQELLIRITREVPG